MERFFATGIAPITLDSMTTGFNIATDITRYPEFVAMIGLTKTEVKETIKEVLPEKIEQEQEEIYNEMEQYYNGYRFSEQSEEKTFNTTLVMYYLKEYVRTGKRPTEMLYINIAAIIEVKYIKKEDAKSKKTREDAIAKKRDEAMEQIKAYCKDTRLPKENMKKFIVIYVGEKLELLEEVEI